jgi:hypothetical protein
MERAGDQEGARLFKRLVMLQGDVRATAHEFGLKEGALYARRCQLVRRARALLAENGPMRVEPLRRRTNGITRSPAALDTARRPSRITPSWE